MLETIDALPRIPATGPVEGTVIDIRTPEAFSAAHIDGAINLCVHDEVLLELRLVFATAEDS